MRRRSVAIVALWTVAAAAAACASGPPEERAVVEGRSSIAAGIDAGHRAVDDLDHLDVRARFNPCRCPAPDFEVHVEGHWRRVLIDGEDDVVDRLQERGESLESTPGLHYFRLKGTFSGRQIFPATRGEYDVFDVQEFQVEDDEEDDAPW